MRSPCSTSKLRHARAGLETWLESYEPSLPSSRLLAVSEGLNIPASGLGRLGAAPHRGAHGYTSCCRGPPLAGGRVVQLGFRDRGAARGGGSARTQHFAIGQ